MITVIVIGCVVCTRHGIISIIYEKLYKEEHPYIYLDFSDMSRITKANFEADDKSQIPASIKQNQSTRYKVAGYLRGHVVYLFVEEAGISNDLHICTNSTSAKTAN